MSLSSSSLKRFSILAAALAPVALVTGCANMVGTAPEGNTFTPAATMTGSLHGGNQPVTGAIITLYFAGTTGYGSTPTPVAQTKSANDSSASFSFSQLAPDPAFANGVHDASKPVYSCPTTSDPQTYLLAHGGSTAGPGSGTNDDAAFIIAVGKCSTASSAFVDMNEVTTVATLAALQQYFNPNSEYLGYASTTQSALGFANAVATIPVMVNVQTGRSNTSFTPTSNVAGVTMTAVPEYAKINTFANVLSACVNTASNVITTSQACSTLFASAVPPPSASVTSQPNLTFSTASDTVQAAYYMLVNPTNSQDPTGKTAALYTLNTGYAPFQPTVSQPLDWTISITYTPSGTCTNANAASFLASAESIAVDSIGGIWFNSGASTAVNALSKISPTGSPSVCAFGNIPAGRGLAVDIADNAWTTGGSTTLTPTASVYEYRLNGSTLNWPTPTAAAGIASDGSGNIFVAPLSATAANGGVPTPFTEYVSGSAATAATAGTPVGGNIPIAMTGLLYVEADPAGRIWAASTSGASLYELYPGGTTPTGGYTTVDVGATIGTTILNNDYGTAIDASNNIFGGNTCCSGTPANSWWKVTPGSTAGTATGALGTKFLGGLVAPRSSAVDGAGNVWAGMGYAETVAVTGLFAVAEVDNTLTVGLSPNGLGTAGPATCSSSGTNCPEQGGFQKAGLGTVRSLAIDPSGNVWAASNGTTQSIVEIVGQAVPVVTPLSVGAKNSTLGTKP